MRCGSLALSAFVWVWLPDCGGSVESTAITSTSGAGGATTSSTSSGGASTDCVGVIDLSVEHEAPQPLGSICNGGWGSDASSTAVGYSFEGGPSPGVQLLVVSGCATPAANSTGIRLTAQNATGPGTYTSGTTSYIDDSGQTWDESVSFEMIVTRLEPVGGTIEGSFASTVTHGGDAARDVSGSFHVCRVADELAP